MWRKILGILVKIVVALWVLASSVQFLNRVLQPVGGAYGAGAMTGSVVMLVLSVLVAVKVYKFQPNSSSKGKETESSDK
jgi:hypothetical protein